MSKILGSFLLLAPLLIGANLAQSVNSQFIHLTGHFSDEDLAKGASPTSLPRTYLYDAQNHLVPPEKWPAELAEAKKHIGDAADCVKVAYGTDIAANFAGLMDAKGRPIQIRDLPKHKWLLIEY